MTRDPRFSESPSSSRALGVLLHASVAMAQASCGVAATACPDATSRPDAATREHAATHANMVPWVDVRFRGARRPSGEEAFLEWSIDVDGHDVSVAPYVLPGTSVPDLMEVRNERTPTGLRIAVHVQLLREGYAAWGTGIGLVVSWPDGYGGRRSIVVPARLVSLGSGFAGGGGVVPTYDGSVEISIGAFSADLGGASGWLARLGETYEVVLRIDNRTDDAQALVLAGPLLSLRDVTVPPRGHVETVVHAQFTEIGLCTLNCAAFGVYPPDAPHSPIDFVIMPVTVRD